MTTESNTKTKTNASEQNQTAQKVQGKTPAEIVKDLDKFIIGQRNAKKAVAIALRNRSRRRILPDVMREEVHPKNIIMIGSTGVGKTEIARRLSKLAKAPFIKVEATKYTEIGYVGRDVESMVRDLVSIAINMTKKEGRKEVQDKAELNAEERVLDLLLPHSKNAVATKETFPGVSSADSKLAEAMQQDDIRKVKTQEVRETLRKKLRDNKLEDKMLEIEQSVSGFPMMQIMSPGGMDDMEMNIQNMLGDFMPKKNKKRRISVEDARKLFIEEEIEKLLDSDKINSDSISLVEEMGIIFLDEIDKISSKGSNGGSAEVSREGVQRDLLPIVEGATINTKFGPVKTDHILFIAAGAFHGSKPSDLIPELQGRFPIRVELDNLTKDDFKKILTVPDNALTKQFEALLGTEGLKISFTDDGIDEIANTAHFVNEDTENIGARRLHTILERIFEEISFEAPDLKESEKTIVIDKAFVESRIKDISTNQDLSRFIL